MALLLSLSSGAEQRVAFVNADQYSKPVEDFENIQYKLGDFSDVLLSRMLGISSSIEGQYFKSNCSLEFGIPLKKYVSWIHPVTLLCSVDGEQHIWPLGEGEFRRAYTKGKILIQGEASRVLMKILEPSANDSDVESPISSRVIAWGPNNRLKIISLRKFDEEAKLLASLECYGDEKFSAPVSCSISN